MDTVEDGNGSEDDFVFLLGEPLVAESASDVEVNLAQTEGQERGEAPEMNVPIPPGQVEPGAETSDESDEFDFYSALRQARADRVVEFSRRNQEIAPSDRAWAAVDPDDDYPYRPKDFIPPGSVGLNQRLKAFKARERLDRVMKVRKVMERVNENSRSARHVGENLVVDEAMVAFRGRHHLRQYNPSKPTKYGYCLRVLAEPDGYILADEVSGARSDPEDMSAYQRAMHGVGQPSRSEAGSHRRYRTVFCDSYYTGAKLADHLFAKDTYLVGTVRRNASTLPTLRHPIPSRCNLGRRPTQGFRDPFPKQNVPRGYSVRYHNATLTAVKWKDTRTLIVLSTATSVGAPDVQITR
ncbi:hypothetical protein Bbelb_386120 [Branchiostoma belcheri]|nr:hypothetical protein Bbelb_386120 [Branchiostoma belcheri]